MFLDAACVGLAPIESKVAVERFLEQVLLCPDRDASAHHIALDQMRGTAVREGARLLGADEDEIALVESTTHGLNVIAAAIPFEPGDNVVLCDLEFLQVAIPWLKLAERDAIAEVRVVANRDGAVPVDAFAELVDDRTRAVVVSSVQWTNGYAVDLHGLADLCRAHGSLLIVDAIQQLGATRLDVQDVAADVVVAGGHKWLNAPFGCGLLYIRRETLPRLRMPSWGYLGLDAPDGGWGRYFATPESTPVRIYDFPTTTKSLEINGTANYPGAVGLGASLELINTARDRRDRAARPRARRPPAGGAAPPRTSRRQPARARSAVGDHDLRGLRRPRREPGAAGGAARRADLRRHALHVARRRHPRLDALLQRRRRRRPAPPRHRPNPRTAGRRRRLTPPCKQGHLCSDPHLGNNHRVRPGRRRRTHNGDREQEGSGDRLARQRQVPLHDQRNLHYLQVDPAHCPGVLRHVQSAAATRQGAAALEPSIRVLH